MKQLLRAWLRRATLLSAIIASLTSMHECLAQSANDATAAKPLAIHIISAAPRYESTPSLESFQKHLESNYRIKCTGSWASDGANELEGLDELATADLLILFARRMKLDQQHMQTVRRHWEQGKPVIGIRTASHAFSREENTAFDRQVLGNHYAGHYGDEEVRVTNVAEAADHPVLRNVGPLSSRKLYRAGDLPKETVVLQVGDNGKSQQPVTITHTYRGGRMFYTSLGIPDDFKDENFVRLLENAVFWTTHRDGERLRRDNVPAKQQTQ